MTARKAAKQSPKQPPPPIRRTPRSSNTSGLLEKAPLVEVAPEAQRSQPHTSALLLTIDQAAQKLCIGRSLMYKLIWEGDVTSIMVGRFRRVSVEELDRYIAAGMLAERMARFGRGRSA